MLSSDSLIYGLGAVKVLGDVSRVGFSGLWFMWTGFGGRGVGCFGSFWS